MTHTAGSNVPHLSALDHVIERLHDLFPWRLMVESVDLEDVDVGSQSLDARINSVKNMLSAQPDPVNPLRVNITPRGCVYTLLSLFGVCDAEVALCQDNDAVARDVVFFKSLAKDSLGFTVRIHISCIPGGYSCVVGMFEEGESGLFVQDPFPPLR